MKLFFNCLRGACALAIAACLTSATAQDANPNTLAVGLGGYSPVSYFEQDQPHHGSPRYRSEHGGVTYFFASAAEHKKFAADPSRYAPAYGGWCAYGLTVDGKFPADPTNYEIVDGKLLVFLRNDELDTRALWNRGDEAAQCVAADATWHRFNHPASRAYIGARNLDADGVALQGYSPVSYLTEGEAQRGHAEFAAEHDGVTYWLASTEEAEAFKADPDRYVPAYGGWCAFGMSVSDKFPVDPTAFKVQDGRLLLFLRNDGIDARALWEQSVPRETKSKADAHWAEVSG